MFRQAFSRSSPAVMVGAGAIGGAIGSAVGFSSLLHLDQMMMPTLISMMDALSFALH